MQFQDGLQMQCQDILKKLSLYQDGELKPIEQEKVTEHLQNCRACLERYEEMERVWQTLGRAPEIDPGAEFYRQIINKINEPHERHPLPSRKRIFQLLASPLTTCTLLIAGLLIGTFLGIFLVGSNLFPFQPTLAGNSSEAVEVFSLRAFDPIPPGTLGDGYLRIVSN